MGVKWNDKPLRDSVANKADRMLNKIGAAMTRDIQESFGHSGASGTRRGATKAQRRANRSKAGEPPHIDTGTLRRSMTWELDSVRGGRIVRIGTNIKYAAPLEFGTNKMAARPFFRPSLARMVARIRAGEFSQ